MILLALIGGGVLVFLLVSIWLKMVLWVTKLNIKIFKGNIRRILSPIFFIYDTFVKVIPFLFTYKIVDAKQAAQKKVAIAGVFQMLFWVYFFTTIITAFGFHPYKDGYLLKQSTYEIGDSVVAKFDDDIEPGIITSDVNEDGKYDVTFNDGEVLSCGIIKIKGIYIVKRNGDLHSLIVSDLNYLKYLPKALVTVFP